MAKFIKLTDTDGYPILFNVDEIISIYITCSAYNINHKTSILTTGLDSNKGEVWTVREPFEQVQKQLDVMGR